MPWPLQYQSQPQTLLASLWGEGRFPHALLLEGDEGSGKRTLARYLCALLLCRSEDPALAPCAHCPSCRKLQSGNHPDLKTLLPEGKSKSIGVEQARAIRADAYIMPHESPCKVYYIPEAQALRPEAQNALLKLLEEPPPSARFILTAPGRGGLLETLCSRLTILPMQELDEAQRLAVLRTLAPDVGDEALLAAQAAAFPTVGQALAGLQDEDSRRCAADGATLLALIDRADRYRILALLSGYEKDRRLFLRLLDALRAACLRRGIAHSVQTLQCAQILAIIDDAAMRCNQNVGLALLSAVFTDALCPTPNTR